MQTQSEDTVQQDKFKAFWERMARHYPLPFDKDTFAETCHVISLVKSKGVEIAGATILDIGCGTGIYTLPLARDAYQVTGLDDSEAMMARFAYALALEGMENVIPITASWTAIDISDVGFNKAFDIAWISMSPAVQTLSDFERMEQCATKWCVYIGWGRKRKNSFMEEIFNTHGLHYGAPPGAEAAYDLLSRSGRKPSLDYFEASWTWTGTVEDAIEDAACFIEMQGGRPQRDLIENVAASHEYDGMISHTTHVEEGLIVWKVE
jgi:SAM-dependent methyltransferase